MKKNKEVISIPTATQEQIKEANEIVNAMAEAGMIVTETDTKGEKLLEVTLAGGIQVICELDDNNKVKKNRGAKM
jgi:hypothetical protein